MRAQVLARRDNTQESPVPGLLNLLPRYSYESPTSNDARKLQ